MRALDNQGDFDVTFRSSFDSSSANCDSDDDLPVDDGDDDDEVVDDALDEEDDLSHGDWIIVRRVKKRSNNGQWIIFFMSYLIISIKLRNGSALNRTVVRRTLVGRWGGLVVTTAS